MLCFPKDCHDMSQTLQLIRELVARQEVRISDHGYDELAEDDILVSDIVSGVTDAVVIEDYPEYQGTMRSCPAAGPPGPSHPCRVGCSKACNFSSSGSDRL